MKLELIAGWQKWYRFWSTRLGLIGTAIATFLIANPDIANTLWLNLPSEIKAAIPPDYMPLIGVSIFFVSLLAKFVAQPKLQEQIRNDQTEH